MSVLDDLARLSAAEDFFAFLDVPFDGAVVRIARLHILRRMGQYLHESDLGGLDDREIYTQCQAHLRQAYEDFVISSPIQERLFKVHKEAVEPKPLPAKPFVPLTSLTLATKQQ